MKFTEKISEENIYSPFTNDVEKKVTSSQEKDDVKREQLIRIEKYFNGVIKSPSYYMLSRSTNITVARYSITYPITQSLVEMTDREYSTLKENRWINGLVIDGFAAIYGDEWNDVCTILTDDTSIMVGNPTDCRIFRKERKICLTEKSFKNIILAPYLYNYHWRLLVFNLQKETVTLLDPYRTESDLHRVKTAFEDFIKSCRPQSPFNRLKNMHWGTDQYINRPDQKENDGHSCGGYVMHYMYCIGKSGIFEKEIFDPAVFRNTVSNNLLLYSENMTRNCVYCFSATEATLICQTCKRKCHIQCTYHGDDTTDDEEKQEKLRLRKTMKCEKRRVELDAKNIFICKLCKKNQKLESKPEDET